jgi:methyl coenzyme M reductase subunit D
MVLQIKYGHILIFVNLQTDEKYAFREINEEKLQMFNLHYKMKIGKKFITKKMLIVNLISLLIFSY